MKNLFYLGLFSSFLLGHGALAATPQSVLDTRQQLLDVVAAKGVDAVPELVAGINNENPLVRRTALHLALTIGAPADEAFQTALNSSDADLRYAVVDGLADRGLIGDYWFGILIDDDPAVQRKVQMELLEHHGLPGGEKLDGLFNEIANADSKQKVQFLGLLATLDNLPEAMQLFVLEASTDPEDSVREAAFQTMVLVMDSSWPQVNEVLQRSSSDTSETVRDFGRELLWAVFEVDQLSMPETGWRFTTDPDDTGKEEEWFTKEYDDGSWRDDVSIEASWQDFMPGSEPYFGASWYRLTFKSPKIKAGQRAWLCFEGADEEAWVWLNGKFIGSHEEGSTGWNVPFEFDVTEALESGLKNQLTVRVRNTAAGGGLWAPVRLRVVEPLGEQ